MCRPPAARKRGAQAGTKRGTPRVKRGSCGIAATMTLDMLVDGGYFDLTMQVQALLSFDKRLSPKDVNVAVEVACGCHVVLVWHLQASTAEPLNALGCRGQQQLQECGVSKVYHTTWVSCRASVMPLSCPRPGQQQQWCPEVFG